MIDIIQTILLVALVLLVWQSRGSYHTTFAKIRPRKKMILDSCALIDGRIIDIVNAGFTPDSLVIPRFIVRELQLLADGQDSQKRERARYGLDAIQTLQANPDTNVEISDIDFLEAKTTDDKLVMLAGKLSADLCTTDYNLNKAASVQGVKVLNVNELSNAIRAVVLPGETKQVAIVQKGSGKDQGVGYLDDGTMVVVAGAAGLVGKSLHVEITRMLQSEAGKMLFAKINTTTKKPSANRARRRP